MHLDCAPLRLGHGLRPIQTVPFVFHLRSILMSRWRAINTDNKKVLGMQACSYKQRHLERLRLSRSRLSPLTNKKRESRIQVNLHRLSLFYPYAACSIREYYLFENCGARRAAFKPYFFLSFILGSLVKKPFFLSTGRKSASALQSALAMP